MGTVQQTAQKQAPPSSSLTYDPYIGTWRPKFEGEVARGRELEERKQLQYVRQVRKGEDVGGKQLQYRRGKLYIVREKTVTEGQAPVTGQVYDVKAGRFVKGVPKATVEKQPERYITAKAQYYSAEGMPLKGVPQATVEKKDYGKAYIYQTPTPQAEPKDRLERLTERVRGIEEKYLDPQFQKLRQVERGIVTKTHQKLPPFFTSGPIKDPILVHYKGPYRAARGLVIGATYIPTGTLALPHTTREFYRAPREVKKQKVKGVALAAAERPAETAGVIGSGYLLGTGLARGFRKIRPAKVTALSAEAEVAYTTKGGITKTRIVGKGAAKVGRAKYIYKKGAVIQTHKVAGAEKPLGLRIRKGQIQKPPTEAVKYQYAHLGGGAVKVQKTSGFLGKKPVTREFGTVGASKTVIPEQSYKSVAFAGRGKASQLGVSKTIVTEKYKIPRKQQLITREKTIGRTYGKQIKGKHVTDTLHFDPPEVLPKAPTKLELQYKPPLPKPDILAAHKQRVLVPRERAVGTSVSLLPRVRTIKAQQTRLGLKKAARQRQYLKTAPKVAVKQAQGLFLGGRVIQSQLQLKKVGLVQKVKPVQRQRQVTRVVPTTITTKKQPVAPLLPLGIGYQKKKRPKKRPRARRPRYKRKATLLPIPDLLSIELSVGKFGKATTPRPTKKVRKEFLGKYRRNPFVYRFKTVEQRRKKKRKGVKLF